MRIIAGIFAIIFIRTISFEKICMESRYGHYRNLGVSQQMEISSIVESYDGLEKENQLLRETLEKKY